MPIPATETPVRSAAVEAGAVQSRPGGTAPRKATVYIADDNPVLLQGLERALDSSGYSVRTAESGPELLAMLENGGGPPDILLLDVMMPHMTGLDVLERVHQDSRWKDLPVMLITAMNDEALPVSALQSGAVDFLTKPFRLGELLARIEAHVQRYRALRRAQAESDVRLQTLDVIRELNRAVTATEMFELVTARASEIWGVSRCSVIVFDSAGVGRIVSSSESDTAVGRLLELERYPEIREAVRTGEPLLVEDVATATLFDDMRTEWQAQGLPAPVRSVVVVPLGLSHNSRGVLILRSTADEPPLGRAAVAVATQVVDAMILALGRAHIYEALLDEQRELDVLAHTDELTGCATRRSLMNRLSEEFFLARRHGQPLSVVILDLDGFKEINDGHGHLAGDKVLRALGQFLRGESGLRARDCAGRYGGDEFVVVLPNTDAAGALRFAERTRGHLAEQGFSFEGHEFQATLSAGVASWGPADSEVTSPDALLSRADRALYGAKSDGRDVVRLA